MTTAPLDDDRLAEIVAAKCICQDCEPGILYDACSMAQELMARRQRERDVREHVADLHQAASRVVTIADEAFGIGPVEPLEATLTRIERGIFEQHRELEQLRQQAAKVPGLSADLDEARWERDAAQTGSSSVTTPTCTILRLTVLTWTVPRSMI